MRPRPLHALIGIILTMCLPAGVLSSTPAYKTYRHTEARAALKKARDECKPLVIHIVPTVRSGRRQVGQYYGSNSPIPRDVLDRVVVLVMPHDKYPALAAALGVRGKAGLRSMSPYDLQVDCEGALITAESYLVRWTEYQTFRRDNPRRGEAILVPQAGRYIQVQRAGKMRHPSIGPNPPTKYYEDVVFAGIGCDNVLYEPWYNEYVISRDRVSTRKRERPAEQAIEYFDRVGRRFEESITENLEESITQPAEDDPSLLAAIQLIRRRGISDFEPELRAILQTDRSGPLGREIHQACLEVLLSTARDRASLSRLLAYLGSMAKPPCGRDLCVEGLRQLRPEAEAEMLDYLGRIQDRVRRRRLASLIASVTYESSPEPLRFWERADDADAVATVIEVWSAAISDRAARTRGSGRVSRSSSRGTPRSGRR